MFKPYNKEKIEKKPLQIKASYSKYIIQVNFSKLCPLEMSQAIYILLSAKVPHHSPTHPKRNNKKNESHPSKKQGTNLYPLDQ